MRSAKTKKCRNKNKASSIMASLESDPQLQSCFEAKKCKTYPL